MFMTLILFVAVLSLLVFVHELGHFVMAKKMGMKVDEFGFGFPPRMIGWRRGETMYSINWIPLGGFVKIKGESGEAAQDMDSFASKKAWQRFIVLVAGVAMNFFLAAVLLSVGFMVGLPSVVDENTPVSARVSNEAITVMSVLPESPADRGGITSGDQVVSVDSQPFTTAEDMRAYIAAEGEGGIEMVVKKQDGSFVTVPLTSEALPDTDAKGVGVGIVKTGLVAFPIHQAIYNGVLATVQYTVEVVKAFAGLLANLIIHQQVSVDLSGPVGIAVMTGEVAAMGIIYLLQFTAILSINLAVVNILPFPALDGGRILFLIVEKIRGKALNQQMEAMAHNMGFLLLMLLVVLVTYRDFVKFGDQIWGALKSIIGA